MRQQRQRDQRRADGGLALLDYDVTHSVGLVQRQESSPNHRWYAADWRGKKGQVPTPPQLFERALMVHGRLETEREADAYRAPVATRAAADFDALPAPRVAQ